MSTLREFIEDWCEREAKEVIEDRSAYPVMATDPSAVESKFNADGTFTMETTFDYDMYRQAYTNGQAESVTDKQLIESISSYLETVKDQRSFLCPTSVGQVFPDSITSVGTIASFTLTRIGRVQFWSADGQLIARKFKCRKRSRRLIRREAKKHLGMRVIEVVLNVVAPINHVELNFTITK